MRRIRPVAAPTTATIPPVTRQAARQRREASAEAARRYEAARERARLSREREHPLEPGGAVDPLELVETLQIAADYINDAAQPTDTTPSVTRQAARQCLEALSEAHRQHPMASATAHNETIISTSLPHPEGERREVWPHPDWEPWTRTPRRPRDGKRPPVGSIVTRGPLLPWERRRLQNLFPTHPATAADAHALTETFYDDQGIPTMGRIRTVILTRPDGKRVEYRTGRLRDYNTTNRRKGLRGVLTAPPVLYHPEQPEALAHHINLTTTTS